MARDIQKIPTTKETGDEGEERAILYLREKGYEILDTKYYYQKKELDIVCCKDALLVVVEVKTRAAGAMENPRDAVTKKKQGGIIQATNAYVEQKDIDLEVRFDIIEVVFSGKAHVINHIEDAFYPLV